MNRNIAKELQILKYHLANLRNLGTEIFQEKIQYDHQNDNLGVMTLFFSTKQMIHLESLLLLAEHNQFSDASLISRTMLEGMAILLWTSRNPKIRALAWRQYSLISDFRLLQKKKGLGESTSDEYEKELKTRLEENCKRFLKSGHLKPNIEDPYRTKWLLTDDGRGLGVKDVFSEIEASKLYEEIYSQLSNWIHWNPAGFSQMFRWEADYLHFVSNPPTEGTSVLMTGFQTVYQTLEILNGHFDLKHDDDLSKIKESLVNSLDSTNST